MFLVFLIFVIYLILAQYFLLGLGTWLLTTMFLLRKLRTRLLGFRDSKGRDLSRTFFGYPNPYKMADSNYRIIMNICKRPIFWREEEANTKM